MPKYEVTRQRWNTKKNKYEKVGLTLLSSNIGSIKDLKNYHKKQGLKTRITRKTTPQGYTRIKKYTALDLRTGDKLILNRVFPKSKPRRRK